MRDASTPRERFLRLLDDTRVYAVTDDSLDPHLLLSAVGSTLRVGIRLVQYREKRRPDRDRVSLARALVEIVQSQGGLLIVNDRADVALAAGADGVHLGQDDLPVEQGRRLLGEGMIVGASASFIEEIPLAVGAGADYVGFGAVFPTDTKPDAEYAGLDLLERACRSCPLPVVGIGGISIARAAGVIECGAAGVAVVSALFGAADAGQAAAALLRRVGAPGIRRARSLG